MAAIDNIANTLANTSIQEHISNPAAGASEPTNAAQNETVLAIVAEGRRLYIGNLAYATTEGDLKEFFKGYLV